MQFFLICLLIHLLGEILWKFDEKTRKLRNNHGLWRYESIEWTFFPSEGDIGSIQVGFLNLGKCNDDNDIDLVATDYTDGQMWKRSKANKNGYFLLENVQTKRFLASSGSNNIIIKGKILNLILKIHAIFIIQKPQFHNLI